MSVTSLSHDLISYTWRTTEWAECRVDMLLSQQDRRRSNQTGLCGGGMQTREVYCIQANADPTSDLSTSQDKPGTNPTHDLYRVDDDTFWMSKMERVSLFFLLIWIIKRKDLW